MRITRPMILAGLAAAAIGVAAYAEAPQTHLVRVALPDGSIRTIRYAGDVPPRIVMVADPFAGLARMTALMNAQADAMMRQVAAAPATPGGPALAALANAPAGARYSYTSTTIVNGKACTTSVESVSQGAGKAPTMLRKVSGDGCSTAVSKPAGPIPAALAATAAPPAPPRSVAKDTI